MTENTNKTFENNTSENKFISLLITLMCAVILIISFVAFRTVENTATAFVILFSGIILDAIIYLNGKHKQ